LEHLGIKLESVQKPEPLLAEDPRNVDAAMMLMRIYAQDLRQPHQAKKNPSGAGKATSCFTCPLRVCPPVHCGMEPGKTQAGKGLQPPGPNSKNGGKPGLIVINAPAGSDNLFD